VRRRQPLLEMEEKEVFYKLVKVSFGQRRKMMLKLVKVAWQSAHLDHYFDQCGLAREARAEAVALDQFVRLAQFLQPH
jgi:16S rRNA A1518/A1519 N6-dimethyltransferase RsmA/KsgA/DIM1 with predicted DNA glycosylase/AP lyase activity